MKKFRQYPLERQLFLCFLAVSALVTAIALVMALYLDIRRQRESIDSVISGTAAFVSSMDEVGDMLRQGYPSTAVSDTLDKLHRTLPEIDAIAVYNRSGLRFYHTDRQEAGETFVSGEETAILEGAAPYIISGYSTFGNQRRAFHAVESGGEIVGFVTVSIFSAGILANTRSLLASFLLVMAVAILAAAALSRGIVTLLKGSLRGHRPEELLDLYLRQGDVLNTLEDGVAAADSEGRVIFANDAACHMLERERQELLGQQMETVFPASCCRWVARTGQNRYRLSGAVGERQLLFSELQLSGGEDAAPGSLLVMSDKTELRKLSDQLSGAQAMLDTLRMFNHEFMNKLHVIMGYLQMGRTEEAMGFIMNTSRVSGQTIRDVADRVRVPELSALIIGKMLYAAERDISLTLLPTTQCRQEDMLLTHEELITVVGNLLENAIDALCAWEGEGKEIRLAVCCRPDCNLIICQDTGPGIPPEIQGRIWDKGVSSKGDGRGFGLYLVSQITRRHNGRIEVDTEQGEGTCFTLTFVKEEETL